MTKIRAWGITWSISQTTYVVCEYIENQTGSHAVVEHHERVLQKLRCCLSGKKQIDILTFDESKTLFYTFA